MMQHVSRIGAYLETGSDLGLTVGCSLLEDRDIYTLLAKGLLPRSIRRSRLRQ